MKVVLAMDTSAASQAVLESALARPWPADTSFEVVSVVEPSHLWTTSEVAQETEKRASEVVKRAVERLQGVNRQAAGKAYTGDPKTVILDHAGRGADLLMVGSHGESAVAKHLLGNVAAAVLRHAPCSVEVVRAKAGAGGAMKILLATDGSEHSELAAKAIAARPWAEGTEVMVLSVVELVLSPARAMFEIPFIDTEYLENARGEAMQRAQDAIAKAEEILSPTGLKVSELTSVLADTPKVVILKEAAEMAADLIVVGSHGRQGVERFLVGSVSEAVATQAECSVEVIRR